MKGRSALALMFACVLFAPGRAAWAQDEDEDEDSSEESASEDEGSEEGAAEEEGSDEEGSSEEASSEEESGSEEMAASGRWPRAVIARPLTLPSGLIQAGGTFTSNNDFKVLGLGLLGGYGVSDDLEVKLGYGFALKEFEIKGDLTFEAGYKLLRGAAGGKLEVIGRVGTGYDVLAEGVDPLKVGAQAQYNISDKLAVITPGQQLVVTLEGDIKPIFLQLPVAVGYQVTPELYAQVDTTLATIEISDAASTYIFADNVPFMLSAYYNVQPALDVFAGFSTDFKNEPGDSLAFFLGATYYAGAL